MKMITLLFGMVISVAVIVAVIVLLVQINKKAKMQVVELQKTRQCLERIESPERNVTQSPAVTELEASPAEEITESRPDVSTDVNIREQDVSEETAEKPEASPYNTGISGKIYTKEELELLIRE